MTNAEWRALRRGQWITKRYRLKSTGEIHWLEIKQSWDTLYYSPNGNDWFKTATEALRAA